MVSVGELASGQVATLSLVQASQTGTDFPFTNLGSLMTSGRGSQTLLLVTLGTHETFPGIMCNARNEYEKKMLS